MDGTWSALCFDHIRTHRFDLHKFLQLVTTGSIVVVFVRKVIVYASLFATLVEHKKAEVDTKRDWPTMADSSYYV